MSHRQTKQHDKRIERHFSKKEKKIIIFFVYVFSCYSYFKTF